MSGGLWRLPHVSQTELTALRARDLMVDCFYEAQCETFARAREHVGKAGQSPKELRASVQGAVRLAFKETGAEWELPTRKALLEVIDVLARKSTAWGTPDDIVRHHTGQLIRLIERLAS